MALRLHDPGYLIAAALGAQALGGIAQGQEAARASRVEADFLNLQGRQEQVASQRDLRDLAKEKGRFLARTRALIAAGGGETTSGTGLALLTSQAAEFGRKKVRLEQDTAVRKSTLAARGRETLRVGSTERDLAIFGGAARFAQAGGTLLKSKPKVTTGAP